MAYVALFAVVIGCLVLIWYLSRRPEPADNRVDVEALTKAAEHGDVFSQYSLALAYHMGRGVSQDSGTAVQWYRRAAEQGHVESQYALGSLLDRGEGVARDSDEAHAWYNKAALHGHEAAQNILASEKWKDNSVRNISAPTQKESQSPSDMSPEALEKLYQQAEAGDVDAMYNLGIMYYNGEGAPKDHQQAMNWFLLAAQQGDADAQFNMGIMTGRGEGVKKDPKTSLQWFQKAAEQGHTEAQDIIAKLAKK